MLKDSKYKLFLKMVKMALFGGMIDNFSMIHFTKYEIYNQYILPPFFGCKDVALISRMRGTFCTAEIFQLLVLYQLRISS